MPDEVLERSGEMRVIEITGLVSRVENGNAFSQEVRRKAGAFDLTDGALSHAGSVEEMPLRGSDGQLLPFPLECSIYGKIHREQTIAHKSFHKDFVDPIRSGKYKATLPDESVVSMA